MVPKEKAEFVSLIAAMASTFRQEATEALFAGYWLGLEDVPFPQLRDAVRRAMRERRFLPCVAELRELAGVDEKPDLAP